jgi:hypothetical protein
VIEQEFCKFQVAGLIPVFGLNNKSIKGLMKINLWWCDSMKQWRWTLVKSDRPVLKQESGQREDLHLALQDIANTVEYMMKSSQE